jgi:hypothetical protein
LLLLNMDSSPIVNITLGHRIEGFAINLTKCFEACNEQCVQFIQFINQQTFKNKKEIEDALYRFRSAVSRTAEGTRHQRKLLCDQIEYALLNPSKVVTDKVIKDSRGRKIDQSIVKLLMPGSCVASPRKCSVCNEGCGIMVTCSSQRCKKPLLHPDCAGQITFSKKNACSYYRCPSCVRPVPSAKPKSKRSSRRVKQPLKKQKRDSSDGGASKNDDAAAGTSKGSASEGSASEGSASEGSASEGSASDGSMSDGSMADLPNAFDHSTSSNRVGQGLESPSCSMSDPRRNIINFNVLSSKNDDAAAGTSKSSASEGSASEGSEDQKSDAFGYDVIAHLDDESMIENPRSEMQSQHTYNDLTDDLSVFESACGNIVFIRDLARNVHEDLNAVQSSVGGYVTVENADKIEAVLNQIKSGVNSLAELAYQYRVAYGMPANAYLPLEGSDVGASDALSNACSEVIAFDHKLSHLYDQFDDLKSQAAVVVSSSKEANAPQHIFALPTERRSSFPSEKSTASASPSMGKRKKHNGHSFEFSSARLLAEPGSAAEISSALTVPPSVEILRLPSSPQELQSPDALTPSAFLSFGNSASTIIASGEQAQPAPPSSLSSAIGLLSAQDDANLFFSLQGNFDGNRVASELHNLAASDKEANESHDAPQHTAASVSTDFQSQSKFSTVSKYTDIVLELSARFSCNFVEHTNKRGTLIEVQSQRNTKIPWTYARHFVSDKYVAKVYRISSDAGSSQFSSRMLSQALHESAATAYVCKDRSWFHDVFGVLIYDSNVVHIHICIIRDRLDSKNVTPNNVADACISLLRSCGVMHGDGHIGNAKCRIGSDVIELLDFERAFMIHSSEDMISMIRMYATQDDKQREALLQEMKTMGMDATRLRFKTFVQGCRVSNINDWTLDAILSVFKGTQFFADISSVERFLRPAVLSRHITTCTFVVKMQPFGEYRLWRVNEST